MKKIILLFFKVFYIQFLMSIPFFFIAFRDFPKKSFTTNIWIASFFPELLCAIYFLYKLKLFKYFNENILKSINNILHNLSYILIGVLLPTLIFLILFAFGLIDFIVVDKIDTIKILSLFGMLFLSAFIEEVFFRFIPFSILKNDLSFKNITLTSLIFSLFHVFNPNFNVLGLLNIFLAGLILSIIYIKTNSIIVSTIFHFSWNFLIGCIYGSNISGLKTYGIINYQILSKNNFLTGANFGFEGSIITSIIFIAFISFLYRNYNVSKLHCV